MELLIFHYHLKPGGVTSVIVDSIKAFLQDNDSWTVRVITGSSEDTEAFKNRLGVFAQRVILQVEPLVGYAEEDLDEQDASERISDIKSLLERLCDEERVFWIHNFHLGKNPYFTEAVIRLAQEGRQKIVLHVHDFPESGRYINLGRIRKYVKGPLYPTSNNVRYALINNRDVRILSHAGIPEDMIFLLDNPYHPLDFGEYTEEKKNSLQDVLKIGQNKKLFLSPVRAIRRKNILESALISIMVDVVYGVSLPGTSGQEVHYSELVARCMRDTGNISSLGITAENSGISFPSVLKSADSLISSSVQEGFGYLFLQAIDSARPLIARRLDIIDGFDHIFENYPVFLYEHFFIPTGFFDINTEHIGKKYQKKIDKLASYVPESVTIELKEEINNIVQKERVEFSFLPVEMQEKVLLKAYTDKESIKAIKQENHGFAENVLSIVSQNIPNDAATRLARFSLAFHKKTMQDIISSFDKIPVTSCSIEARETEETVLHSFARVDYLRLLYDF
ncbi:glycosyltransferase family 1 protein [Spirochaetia bacterium 38H-sp]|uniref:Glycosyltransferase family 1 protein n=1 Tax=Rarispira pelagica TaxID=3141764 RepID=A0ABU9UBX1_9SPIR